MSGGLSIIDGDQFALMDKVVELGRRGLNETEISKQVNVPRKEVIAMTKDYYNILANDNDARDMARDHLNKLVKHFDTLIKEYYALLDDLKLEPFNHQIASQINSALKEIGNLESKRLDSLQKAGLLDASELGDEMAEMEDKQNKLISILRNDLCPNCQKVVAAKLQEVTNMVEVVQVG